ncbi:hypothetical protein AT6N2_C2274 [Agrobacterium tumefaciens]|nr:hypothetical protein AT6N2_C2274 [Agrobacterium tumefaciens]
MSANTSIAPAKRPPKRIVYLVLLISPVGRRERRRGQGSIGLDDLIADLGGAGTDHADVLGGSLGKIENAALDEWPAVVDAHHDRLAVAGVGNLDLGAEPQGAVSGCQVGSVHTLA